jgi:hypothetical protein
MDQYHRTWLLLSKKLTGEATENELAAFQELLHEQPFLTNILHFFIDFWKLAATQHDEETETVFKRRLARMQKKGGIIF